MRLQVLPALVLPIVAFTADALADHPFLETHDDAACCLLEDNEHIKREVVLAGADFLFSRSPLVNFLDEPLLPVANDGDLELLWNNAGLGDGVNVALTGLDDGGYNEMAVTMETDFAVYSVDLENGMPHAGVVVRHIPSPQMFYAAFGTVALEGPNFTIRLHLEKWIVDHFEPLDIGPPPSDPFSITIGENFHVTLVVSEPGADGTSQLAASLDRLRVEGGVVVADPLVFRTGLDDDLRQGHVGVYAAGGTIHTEVAFDDGRCAVGGAIGVEQTSWGRIKALYH
jgi:hypothetical protein